MTQTEEPNAVLYSRNGFAGPMSTMLRSQYSTDYTHIKGDYAPQIFDLHEVDEAAFADSRAMPVPVLREATVSLEVAFRRETAPFATRNVYADEVHVILAGAATLETEFGVLQVVKDDIILIPRATSYLFTGITGELREFIIVTENELNLAMAPGMGPLVKMDTPAPYADPSRRPGEFETVLRHGDQLTSVYTDYDPLPTIATQGSPLLAKVNIHDIRSVNVKGGLLVPPLIINDATTKTLIYDLSARTGDRPPIHYNADYDEVFIYLDGPGVFGGISRNGTLTHTPKGFPHRGPVEDVPEGFRGLLIETRARLVPTEVGKSIGRLVNTDHYTPHPSGTQHG
jgi:homogentisate 1,2-dioxygenase